MRAAVADAHALIWLHTRDRKLGKAAAQIFADADQGQCLVFVSTLVLVEIAEATHLGRVRLNQSFDRWVDSILVKAGYQPVDLTLAIARRAMRCTQFQSGPTACWPLPPWSSTARS